MNKAFSILFCLVCLISGISAQVITLGFHSLFNGQGMHMDSLRITDLTNPGSILLTYPTSLEVGNVGIAEPENLVNMGFSLQRYSENQVTDKSQFQLQIPRAGKVDIRVSNISGDIIQNLTRQLPAGQHLFAFSAAEPGLYIFSASFESEVKSIKVITKGENNNTNHLSYQGFLNTPNIPKSTVSALSFNFVLGDSISMKGWFLGDSAVLFSAPFVSTEYTFNFSDTSYCPDHIVWQWQTIHNVQIGQQCWMKQNLNIGIPVSFWPAMTPSPQTQVSNNAYIEKYCMNENNSNCVVYGGLYSWDEMMNYSTVSGAQGICSGGWHIPTNAEWCTLATFVDGMVDCFNSAEHLGNNAGDLLKEQGTIHWDSQNTGATNASGFTALGGGGYSTNGLWFIGEDALFWTSSGSGSGTALAWGMSSYDHRISHWHGGKFNTYSVRCIRN